MFTPQLVINGTADGVGNGGHQVLDMIRKAESERDSAIKVEVKVDGEEVVVTGESEGERCFDILLVVYDPNEYAVKVERGENRGRTLPHRNLVKSVKRIGVWKGGVARVRIPDAVERLERVVLLQEGSGGRIAGACRV